MEAVAALSLLCCTIPLIILLYLLLFKPKHYNLPPSPPSWPLIGSIPAILGSDKPLHLTLTDLAKTHGPLMLVTLGTAPTVVASTRDAAMEVLKSHDKSLSGRHIRMSFRIKEMNKHSLVWSNCTDTWKLLRRLARTEIFSPKMLQNQEPVRERKVGELVEFLREKEGKVLMISEFVFGTLLNILGNVIFSKDVFGYGEKNEIGMQSLIKELLVIGASPNVAEFYPVLEPLDLQGLRRRCADRVSRVNKLWESTVKERRISRSGDPKDMLDVLLDNGFDDVQINVLFLETFGPGSETSSATIEWAIAELIRNPDKLAKVRQELDQVVGPTSQVKESHIPQLPYLQACMKETMRLHPAAPFLLPHRAVETCQVMGYTIPKDYQLLVNAYAIQRDPNSWKEPSKFMPERFLESEADYNGNYFDFIPFGSGRRICIGMPLATRTIPLIVSSLVHNFSWSLPDGKRPEELAMNEMLSLSLAIDPSLTIIPKVRIPHA
ncbi:hypothetical protein Scep_024687 [Stephania cephalantha]|uniref:Cytochrome P450 n=1 Tax=Stephania cephalantha TaxID=152367 RepID=A0AAP0EZY2_9MAGN